MIKQTDSHAKGIGFILISAFFYGSYGVWSRLMASSFGEFSQAWTRGLLLMIVILLLNFKLRILKPIRRQDLPWFVIIGLAGGLNQAPYYFGFKHLSIGTATLLFYAALVIAGYLIGKIAFNEKLTRIKIISLILALLGMIIIYKFTLVPDQFLAAGFTILAGLMGGCSAVLPKKLSGTYKELQIMLSYFIVMVMANSILSIIFHDPLPSYKETSVWLAQIGYAVAMLVANWSVIEGFKHIEASVGSLIGLAEIIFGIGFGIILFGESMTIGVVFGAGLIIISAALPNLIE